MRWPAPASGAVVMGTGIVSIALAMDHEKTLSLALLIVAAAVWSALGASLAMRIIFDRTRLLDDAHSPAALTGVAATAVLGARVVGLGWDGAALALLLIAALLWLALIAMVLRNVNRPAEGVVFMTTVSTESLSVLAAVVAVAERSPGLLDAALAAFVLGLVLYGLVLPQFDLGQLTRGCGDHWVSGGALAIATLALARIVLAIHAVHELRALVPALKVLTLILWSVSALWLIALLAAELARPRLSYDVRRWATVFPVGMYAASSFDAGAVARVSLITEFAQVWVWVAVGVWAVVFVAMAYRLIRPS